MPIHDRMSARCNRILGCRYGCCVPDRRQKPARHTRRIERAALRRYLREAY